VSADREFSALVGLAALPSMSPMRLRLILQHHTAAEALAELAAARALAPGTRLHSKRDLWPHLQQQAAVIRPEQVIERCRELAVEIVPRGAATYPEVLVDDPQAPEVLFALGDMRRVAGRRVAIVGTRNATAAGRATASELGEALAGHDVTVVSGLARGIDAAAHRGVRVGGGWAVGVVGNGLDRPYPRQNTELWRWVSEHGVMLSEWPPGTPPEPWRFPQRNRIIAALSEVVVVVESRESGGSLITAVDAAERGVPVLAVPGSPRNPAAAGTNKLLVDGATPATCVDDVLVALGLHHGRALPAAGQALPPDLDGVLHLCCEQPSTIGMVAEALAITFGEAGLALKRLETAGYVVDSGGWFESSRSIFVGPSFGPTTDPRADSASAGGGSKLEGPSPELLDGIR
jgi:DNA processing protein